MIALSAGPGSSRSADRAADEGFVDPRKAKLPGPHRFRLGLEFMYIRLTRAIGDDGRRQRFHFAPIMIEAAYHGQFVKYLMVRPSVAIGANAGNSWAAMLFIIHPALHIGYQGPRLGVAAGYGWFSPLVYLANAIDPVRGGLGAPAILNNHHVNGEISLTTKVDRGAIYVAARFGAVTSHVIHYDIDKRRWFPLVMASVGWYFGDGSKQKKWQRQRELRRSVR